MRQFAYLKTWEDVTEIGRVFRLAGDEARYDLGDLALFVCGDRKPGRPLAGAEDKTVTEFAREIGELRPVVSQTMSMSEFLADDADRQRLFGQGVGWHIQNQARIRTGWKPGEVVTEKQAALFWDITLKAADGAAAGLPVSPLQHEIDWLQRENERLGRHGLREGRPDAVYHALADAQTALAAGCAVLKAEMDLRQMEADAEREA